MKNKKEKSVKVYIAGPMRGIPFYNFPAFDKTRAELLEAGHDVISPASMDRLVGFDAMKLPPDTDWSAVPAGFDFDACVERDVAAVMGCDEIYLLDGWRRSKGTRAELALAQWLGKHINGTPGALADLLHHDVQPGEDRTVDPATGGEKGSKLARFDLLPWDALWHVAEHYGRGAAKYADRNWEKGFKWSLCHAALHRHLAQFWQMGERTDAETGGHHLAAVAFHALALLAFDLRLAGTDDRPRAKEVAQ